MDQVSLFYSLSLSEISWKKDEALVEISRYLKASSDLIRPFSHFQFLLLLFFSYFPLSTQN